MQRGCGQKAAVGPAGQRAGKLAPIHHPQIEPTVAGLDPQATGNEAAIVV